MFSIYILKDPRYFQPRYVGRTKNVKKRYYGHVCLSQLKKNTHKNNWIKSLLRENIKPEIEVIEEIEDGLMLKEREIYWIAYFRNIGYNLTNATKGGDGCLGPSEETKRKISESKKKSGYRHSPETRLKLSLANLGKKNPHTKEQDIKTSLRMKGKPLSPEHRAKCKFGRLGKTPWNAGLRLSPEHCEKLSEAHKGLDNHQAVLTKEQVIQIRKEYVSHSRTFGAEALGKKYGVAPSTIIHAIRFITWKNI